MKIFLMADYPVGLEVVKHLLSLKEEIVGAAVHSAPVARNTEQILDLLDLPGSRIFKGEDINSAESIQKIKELAPDLILCVYWAYILKPELIEIPSKGCINFHSAYLPYNRGKNPNIWPIIEGTPAGVTLHYIDPGIDSGDIAAQQEVRVESTDTAKTLYDKCQDAFIALFKQSWPEIKSGNIKRKPQDNSKATFHYAKDLKKLDEIRLDEDYKARDLLNILRARTFPPYPSAYFIDEDGRKVYVRLQLEYAE